MLLKKSIIGTAFFVVGITVGAVFLLPPHLLPTALSNGPFSGSQGNAAEQQIGDRDKQNGERSRATKLQASNDIQGNKLLVSVVNARKQTQQPLVTGYGEVNARWSTELTAEVSGRVDDISEKLLAGSSFKKGEVLARINTVDYESDLATAKAELATARVSYMEQQRETEQAKKRWELSGLSGSPSALTLQKPQLAQALASLESAKASVAKAAKNLSRTSIIAPFDGRVSSRSIDLGGYVTSGETIGTVFATNVVEIEIALTEQQFSLLDSEDNAINKAVTLLDTADNNAQWKATIARFQYHIASTDRTRNLVLEVSSDQAEKLLMPGTFVKALIPGKPVDDLLKLPASALSQEGYIWYVDNNMLQRFKADIAYRKGDYLVVRAVRGQDRLQVVRYPQSAFLPGQAVSVESVAHKYSDNDGAQVIAESIQPMKSGAGS